MKRRFVKKLSDKLDDLSSGGFFIESSAVLPLKWN